jgi:hypothetical protein
VTGQFGYLHPNYAASLREWGQPRELPACRGWVLERAIPDSEFADGMGCYPVFCCEDFTRLPEDIAKLSAQLVSLAMVVDSFGAVDEPMLRTMFDRVVAFKSHFVTELNRPWDQIASKHHRYYARKAATELVVEPVRDLSGFLAEWCALYGHLAHRHGLRGLRAFSNASFAAQFGVPGVVALRARYRDQTVGAQLWMLQDGVAHSHLAAFNELGYDLMAAYALHAGAIEYFAGKVRWLNLGAGAGLGTDGTDGLTQFKRGWSTATRTAWFCGSVLQPERYSRLAEQTGTTASRYFPAYRDGEF